jgi:hypothetical protein
MGVVDDDIGVDMMSPKSLCDDALNARILNEFVDLRSQHSEK